MPAPGLTFAPEAPELFEAFRERRTRPQRRRAAWERAYALFLHLPAPVRRLAASARKRVRG